MTSQQTHDVDIRYYAPLDIIIAEGAPADYFYVVLQGTVEISQNLKPIRTLRDGDVFGLENYYRRRPYTTTASAITNARIAAYRSETIREILFAHPILTEQIFSSVMGQLEQTTTMAEENIPFDLFTPARERVYRDGEVIVAENETGNEIYRLIEAQHGLRVTCKGREIGTITRPGEFFGEMSPILRQPRSATVTAMGRCRVQVFVVNNFAEDLRRYPDLALDIIGTLAMRLREANRRLAEAGPAVPK